MGPIFYTYSVHPLLPAGLQEWQAWLFLPDSIPKAEAPILPDSCFLGTVSWSIEEAVRGAASSVEAPASLPPSRLFVPPELRSQLIRWAYSSNFACHPGARCTEFILGQRFWRPNAPNQVQEFVDACPVCAQNKTPHKPPAGLLRPLPMPCRPWSVLALDFVTGLPPPQGTLPSSL